MVDKVGSIITQKLEIDLKPKKKKRKRKKRKKEKGFLFGRLMRDIISWGLRVDPRL